ncbi:MAG: hypothetical protein JJU33_12905 [Phycisphaerales bacterium]|nr:hypothetical protein [Phycisphaerales bacterium]
MDAADRKTLKKDDSRWERGDWEHDPKEDPDWNDPSLLRRRIGTREELEAVADAIVRGYEIRDTDPEGNDQAIVTELSKDDRQSVRGSPTHAIGRQVIVEDLRALIEAAQRHPDVRLARFEEKEDEAGILRVTRRWVTNRDGTELTEETDCTTLAMFGCVVERACREPNSDKRYWFYVGVALSATVRFNGAAFFLAICFGGAAEFKAAHFCGDADFRTTRFGGHADFLDARFCSAADFRITRFCSDAIFRRTRFCGNADFLVACFCGRADFACARFSGAATFWDARFCGVVEFGYAEFNAASTISGDLRKADIRDALITHPRKYLWLGRIPLLQRLCARLSRLRGIAAKTLHLSPRQFRQRKVTGWAGVRSKGELSILSRISVVAIILVPPIASVWPAIRAGVIGYNRAVDNAAELLLSSAESLDAAVYRLSELDDLDESALLRAEAEVNAVIENVIDWKHQFKSMAIDHQYLPVTLAFAFFAAFCVTLAQFMYQTWVPQMIRRYDEEDFVRSKHQEFTDDEHEVVRRDMLSEACEALEAAARQDRFSNANLVLRHGQLVWIPPRNQLDWFEDGDLKRFMEAEKSDGAPSIPVWYVRGKERARIAIEEGARARYWCESRKHIFRARICTWLYRVGVWLVLGVLVFQAWNILKAAGVPWF